MQSRDNELNAGQIVSARALGKVLAVASAKDYCGKTTFASCLACVLAAEADKQTLYVDLDLCFGNGTTLLGVTSLISLNSLISSFKADKDGFIFYNEAVKLNKNFYVLPAPRSLEQGERILGSDVLALINHARCFFDYIILDTASSLDDVFYTALDSSDKIFFMLDFSSLFSVNDNVRFFHGLSKRAYAPSKLVLLANAVDLSFSASKTNRLFPYPVVGGLPKIKDYQPKSGQAFYDAAPESPYIEVLRMLARSVLNEPSIKKPEATDKTVLAIFDNVKDPEQLIKLQLSRLKAEDAPWLSPVIKASDIRAQVKYVRYNLLFGYTSEAKSNLRKFIEYSPHSAPLYELLGETLMLEGFKLEAFEAFKKAIEANPKQHLALGFLAHLEGNEEYFSRAASSIEEQINENPSYVDLYNDYGKIYMYNERYNEAAGWFERALEGNKSYLAAKLNLALCYSKLNKNDEAIEMLFAVSNKTPRVYAALGQILKATGRFFWAYKAYSRAQSLCPDLYGVKAEAFNLQSYFKKLCSVIELYEGFVNTKSSFSDLHLKLAELYLLAGRTNLASAEYNKAIELNPSDTEAKAKLKAIENDKIRPIAEKQLLNDGESYKTVSKLLARVNFKTAGENGFELNEETLLQIKNVRTKRIMQRAITVDVIASEALSVDVSPIGAVEPQDILLFNLINTNDGSSIRFAPRYIEESELKNGELNVELSLLNE